jgi:hypothetical protein
MWAFIHNQTGQHFPWKVYSDAAGENITVNDNQMFVAGLIKALYSFLLQASGSENLPKHNIPELSVLYLNVILLLLNPWRYRL